MSTFDLQLIPASKPGRGHLMRCYALAQEAVAMGAKAVVVLDDARASDVARWPCAVSLTRQVSRVTIVDASGDTSRVDKNFTDEELWYLIDKQEQAPTASWHDGIIFPHFGASAVFAGPSFVGEQWMPIRPLKWSGGQGLSNKVLSYRFSYPGAVELTGDMEWEAMGARSIICPPSMIAYEAMAIGMHVVLHNEHDYPDIAKAMIAAGMATSYEEWRLSSMTPGRARHVDTHGGSRLLKELL